MKELIERIRDTTKARVFIAASGAGAGIQNLLWSVPGCSSFLVGAAFPYSTDSTDDFLGFKPEKYCSAETAMDMAMTAFMRAGASEDAIGIGVTGSVASTREHRGPHQVIAASFSARAARVHTAELEKGTGDARRALDGAAADEIGLNALLDALDLPVQARHGAAVLEYEMTEEEALARARFFTRPYFRPNGTREAEPTSLRAALPGTFDPPHEGHYGMAEAYRGITGFEPTFWATAEPPHKPPVAVAELLRRARLLKGRDALFTRHNDTLYLDKAKKYPGCHFLVGADSFARMMDPKWGPEIVPMLRKFVELKTRFYVADRTSEGNLTTLADVPLPTKGTVWGSCFATRLPGRWDVSSSEIRARALENERKHQVVGW